MVAAALVMFSRSFGMGGFRLITGCAAHRRQFYTRLLWQGFAPAHNCVSQTQEKQVFTGACYPVYPCKPANFCGCPSGLLRCVKQIRACARGIAQKSPLHMQRAFLAFFYYSQLYFGPAAFGSFSYCTPSRSAQITLCKIQTDRAPPRRHFYGIYFWFSIRLLVQTLANWCVPQL